MVDLCDYSGSLATNILTHGIGLKMIHGLTILSPTLTGKIFTRFLNMPIISYTNNGSHSLLCLFFLFFFLLFFSLLLQKHIFNTASHSLAQAGLKLVTILLLKPPEYGDDRSERPYLIFFLVPNLFLYPTSSVCSEFHFSFLSSFFAFFHKSLFFFFFQVCLA